MRKIVALILSLVIVIPLAGCGQPSETGNRMTTISQKVDATETEAGIVVDKKLFSVEITLPAHMVKDMTEDGAAEMTAENGFESYKLNADGSLTYKMSRSKHSEFLDSMKANLDTTIEESIQDPDSSITGITYNDSLSEFNIQVDSEKYSIFDTMASLGYYLVGSYYQIFNGVNAEEIEVLVNFIDEDKNVLDTGSYQEWLEDLEETTAEGG